jgi:uncharacterized protein (TIGR03083 family)
MRVAEGLTTTEGWVRARAALGEAVGQVTALLRSGPDPAAPAVGEWNVGELAMHLSQAWLAVPGLARADLSGMYDVVPSLADQAGDSLVADLWDLADTTQQAVEADTERDLSVLADRIEQRAAAYLAEADAQRIDDRRAWLVSCPAVPMPMLTHHLLNETVVHGYDIARATGKPYRIDPEHASMILSGFIVQVFRSLPPATLVDPVRGAVTATFALHIRGGATYHFVFAGGEVRVEDPAPRRIDCHISADPVAFLLVTWGRRSQWQAIARGQLVSWGRKPWLGTRFRKMIRNP